MYKWLFLPAIVLVLIVNPLSASESQNGEYIIVNGTGQGTTRESALNQAWMDAVRIAVGMVVSGTTHLDNDDLTEKIITHSRGVVEGFSIIDEQNDGKRITITIEAKVHKETLIDATKTYGETQTVKASTSKAVKAQQDTQARNQTKTEKQQSALDLLQELLDNYTPAMFYSATLNPEIQFDKEKGKPYVEITHKFNEDLFWKDFLPRLRTAVEGFAVKKENKTYPEGIRALNQQLAKQKYVKSFGDNQPYGGEEWRNYSSRSKLLTIQIPDHASSYAVYSVDGTDRDLSSVQLNVFSRIEDIGKLEKFSNITLNAITTTLLEFLIKMNSTTILNLTCLDTYSNTIHVQPINIGSLAIATYRSYTPGDILFTGIVSFGPGFSVHHRQEGSNYDFTTLRTPIILDIDGEDLQQIDQMQLEVIFEK